MEEYYTDAELVKRALMVMEKLIDRHQETLNYLMRVRDDIAAGKDGEQIRGDIIAHNMAMDDKVFDDFNEFRAVAMAAGKERKLNKKRGRPGSGFDPELGGFFLKNGPDTN